MIKQRTLRHSVSASGVGVHSGEKVVITLHPAPVDTGIVFRRVDCKPPVDVKASLENIDSSVAMSTALYQNGMRVGTVEHLLSALVGFGIDNAIIELDAAELPIMDGSSAAFGFLIKSAGILDQNSLKKFIRILKEVRATQGNSLALLKPFAGFRLNYEMAYSHPAFSEVQSSAKIDFSEASYATAVSRARTFGFLADYERVKEMGYAKGSSLANSVVFDDYRVLNETGLRYENECARHKILDAIGDLFLMGGPLLGEFYGYKSGHALNHALAKELLADQSAWEWVTFDESEKTKALPEYPLWLAHPI